MIPNLVSGWTPVPAVEETGASESPASGATDLSSKRRLDGAGSALSLDQTRLGRCPRRLEPSGSLPSPTEPAEDMGAAGVSATRAPHTPQSTATSSAARMPLQPDTLEKGAIGDHLRLETPIAFAARSAAAPPAI